MYILGQIKSNFKGAAVHQTCQFINGGTLEKVEIRYRNTHKG